jgi:predicted nucleic acid-binding protein
VSKQKLNRPQTVERAQEACVSDGLSNKAIILDANILIRAVLGKRVRELIVSNAQTVQFFAPDVAYADARKYLPTLLEKRSVNSESAMTVLDALASIVRPLELGVYAGLQAQALQRISIRDAEDWPGRWVAFRLIVRLRQFAEVAICDLPAPNLTWT